MRESPLINASVCAPDFFLAYKVRGATFQAKKGQPVKKPSAYVNTFFISEPSFLSTLHLTLFPKEMGQG